MKKKGKDNKDNIETEEILEQVPQTESEVCENEDEKTTDNLEKENIEDAQTEKKDKECECKKIQKQADEYKDRLLRLQADFENFKKRNQREKLDIINRASEGLIIDLLPALDNFDRALEVEVDENSKSLYEGVEMVHNQILEVLKNNGLEEIESLNEKFDPNSHSAAVLQESKEHEPDTVINVLSKGYKYKDKVIRHSTVIVSK